MDYYYLKETVTIETINMLDKDFLDVGLDMTQESIIAVGDKMMKLLNKSIDEIKVLGKKVN